MLGHGGESKIAILWICIHLGILFVISGEFVLFFNEFVNFAKFYKNVTTFVLYSNISISDSPPASHIFKNI